MPKIQLTNMAAKILVDLISMSSWMEKGYEDMYVSGSILAEVLPRFEDQPVSQKSPQRDDTPVDIPADIDSAPLYCVVSTLTPPSAPVLDKDGGPDWARMTREETLHYRNEVQAHNKKFLAWSRTKLSKALTFTDRQFEVCQRVLRFYAPRSEAEKAKDQDAKRAPRPELTAGEFSLELLKAFNLTIAL